MSLLLAIAVVLLVIVAGLTILQRRARDPGRSATPVAGASGPPRTAARNDPAAPTEIADPVLGAITYAGHGFWTRDLDFAATTLQLEICTGTNEPVPPAPEVREYFQAALSRETDLDSRARAAILADARQRGMIAPDATVVVSPNQLSIGLDGDRVFRGYVWYSSADPEGEFGVSSTDAWQTLTVEFIE